MIKTLIAVAVAGLATAPLAAPTSVAGDNLIVAQAGGGMSAQPGTMSSDKNAGTARRADHSAAGKSTDERFDRLDRNHDGYISRDEAKDASELNTRFSELDKNNDGKLSRDEYNALNAGSRGANGAEAGAGATTK
jgi:ribulose 1,5-bisphosphate carboxylase large subunit-like protein